MTIAPKMNGNSLNTKLQFA